MDMLDASNPNLFSSSLHSFPHFPSLPLSPLLQSHDCLRNGPPEMGELMLVHTMEGKALNASYVKDHVHKHYQVSCSGGLAYSPLFTPSHQHTSPRAPRPVTNHLPGERL